MSCKILTLLLSFFLLTSSATFETKACSGTPGKPAGKSCSIRNKTSAKQKTSEQASLPIDIAPFTLSFFLN